MFDLRLYETPLMVIGPFEDWSRVRSPSRARRRRAKHRQNIRIFYKPDPKLLKTADGAVYGHPVTIRALRAALRAKEPAPVYPPSFGIHYMGLTARN